MEVVSTLNLVSTETKKKQQLLLIHYAIMTELQKTP